VGEKFFEFILAPSKETYFSISSSTYTRSTN